MKAELVQISWHTKEPIFSVDFHSSGRLATCGGDNAVRIWSLHSDEGKPKLLSSLLRHLSPVNCVRFSPDSTLLASGSDDGFVILWKLSEEPVAPRALEALSSDEPENVEDWTVVKSIHANKKDVYDMCWAPDSSFFITASTDNSAAIWKTNSSQPIAVLTGHIHFVQGVAWDPLGKFVATQSSDRTARIYKRKTPTSKEFSSSHLLNFYTQEEQVNTDEENQSKKKQRLFLPDSIGTFFRRLCWSPDGSLLFTPCAQWKNSPEEPVLQTTLAWSRFDFNTPLIHLPCGLHPSFIVRCYPSLLELRKNEEGKVEEPWLSLPYRMMFAVATKSEVLIYDTQHKQSIGKVEGFHLASLTDMAWSLDGRKLVVSSRDAFCSIISFEKNELGSIYSPINQQE